MSVTCSSMRARLPLTHPQGRHAGMAAVLAGRAFCGFPGVLLSRWPLRACRYRRGSADAARSLATDPAPIRAEPAAILGLRRCTARAARRTLNTVGSASAAIASTVSRRGWRRRNGTPMTIPATVRTGLDQRKNRDSRRPAGVSVPAVAGASASSLRKKSLRCPSSSSVRAKKFSSASAPVGASVPRPHATSPKPAAPAHSARARCRRPAAQCPAPAAAWVTNGGGSLHPSERPRGPGPVQKGHKGQPQPQPPGLAVITSHPVIVAQAARVCHYAPQARGPFTCMRSLPLTAGTSVAAPPAQRTSAQVAAGRLIHRTHLLRTTCVAAVCGICEPLRYQDLGVVTGRRRAGPLLESRPQSVPGVSWYRWPAADESAP